MVEVGSPDPGMAWAKAVMRFGVWQSFLEGQLYTTRDPIQTSFLPKNPKFPKAAE